MDRTKSAGFEFLPLVVERLTRSREKRNAIGVAREEGGQSEGETQSVSLKLQIFGSP